LPLSAKLRPHRQTATSSNRACCRLVIPSMRCARQQSAPYRLIVAVSDHCQMRASGQTAYQEPLNRM
jgi:hypothetical protein